MTPGPKPSSGIPWGIRWDKKKILTICIGTWQSGRSLHHSLRPLGKLIHVQSMWHVLHVSQKLFSNCKKKSNQEEVDMNYGALCYLENLDDLVIHYVRRSTGQKLSTET